MTETIESRLSKHFGSEKEDIAFPYHGPESRPELFRCISGSSIELEYLGLIHALIRSIKPLMILETGPFWGYSTIALADALKQNGFGKVTAIDNRPENIAQAKLNLTSFDPSLVDLVDFQEGHSLDVIPRLTNRYDMALFDSGCNSSVLEVRIEEIGLVRKNRNFYGVFHDTSPFHRRLVPFREKVEALEGQVLSLDLSRGLTIVKIISDKQPKFF